MSDEFFKKTKCDRCGADLRVRTMSWFNKDTLCMDCADKEAEIKRKLREQGKDPAQYEGCGHVPDVETGG